jgi:hypothetical protein
LAAPGKIAADQQQQNWEGIIHMHETKHQNDPRPRLTPTSPHVALEMGDRSRPLNTMLQMGKTGIEVALL